MIVTFCYEDGNYHTTIINCGLNGRKILIVIFNYYE